MPPAPIPPNETQRLASVRGLRDLGHAHRATQAVLSLLREQIAGGRAFVNIVDEATQHPFLCDPGGAESSPRTFAFCGHVVYADAPLIVPDASADARFADNPFVMSGEIGFYYGAPVYTPEGHVAGALCVHGPGARQALPHEIPLLLRLADLVSEELRLARRFAEVESGFRVHAEQLRLMIEHTPAPLAMFDDQMRYIAASRMWCDRWNADPTALRGAVLYEACPWLPERLREQHRRCLDGETLSCDEDRIEWPDGRTSVVRWRLVPWYTRGSEIGGMIVFSEDITDAVESRERIERANERLTLSLEAAKAGLWDWDVRTNRIHRDDLWWQVHGHPPGSISDDAKDGWRLVHPDDRPLLGAMLRGVVEGGRERVDCAVRVADAHGRYRWFEVNGFAAERDGRGRATRVVGLNLDVDDRKRLEIEREGHIEQLAAAKKSLQEHARRLVVTTRQAKDARAAAEAASEAKSRFLANMSHEIRTPMSAILGFAEVFEDDDADDDARAEAVATIRRNGEHLLTLINEILDLSKVETGRLTTERVRSDPRVMLREAVKAVSRRAAAKGLEIGVEVADDVPDEILTDPTRLRQVLVNLLDNAVKFTQSGSVRIAAARGDGAAIVVEITDTGIGMTPETASGMFEPFAQADGSTTRRYGGTGLGLAISSRLATLLGGGLEVARTAPGEGTTMRLTIDAGPGVRARMPQGRDRAAEQPARARGSACLSGVRILLAEDGPDNQRLFSFMLTRAGATVRIVGDGRQALEAIGERDPPPFDLLLLDMQMPEMDGFETAAVLRARGIHLPIVALTANAMDGDRERCLAAGCDDYASKPISSTELTRICEHWALSRADLPHGERPGVSAGDPATPAVAAQRPAA